MQRLIDQTKIVYDRSPAEIVFDIIESYMAPFKTKNISISYQGRSPSEPAEKIAIEVQTLPGFVFKYDLKPAALAAMDVWTQSELAEVIGLSAGLYFSSIYIEPESTIELGEN